MKRFKYIVKVTPHRGFPSRYYLQYFDSLERAEGYIERILLTADKAVLLDSDKEEF